MEACDMEFKEDIGLRVEITNDKEEILEIFYDIVDSDIANRWVNVVQKNIELQKTVRFNYRRFLNKRDRKKVFNEFRSNIGYINNHYDRKLPDIVSFEFLQNNQHILNELHEEFEVYGDRLKEILEERYYDNPTQSDKYHKIWPGDSYNRTLHEKFLRLNEEIHNFEALYRKLDEPDNAVCTCLIDFYPYGIHEPLKNEDYFLFDINLEWGWMYLGYNTLGKTWHSVFEDDDTDVVIRKQIRPQQRFAAEFYMNFVPLGPNYFYKKKYKFYNWWIKNKFSELYPEDFTLREMPFGYIPIGRIYGYYTNKTFTKIIQNTNRINFNKNVWSRFNKIKSVSIQSKKEITKQIIEKTEKWVNITVPPQKCPE